MRASRAAFGLGAAAALPRGRRIWMAAGPPARYRAASPFRSGSTFRATESNSSARSTTGEDTETTTSASFQNGKLELNFEHYLTSIQATVKNGELDGKISDSRAPTTCRDAKNAPAKRPGAGSPFHATRYVAPTAAEVANVPSIDGVWEIPHESHKGEKAWRLIVKQNGADITTTILRVDGDTGALTGSWQDGKFVASHFDGARPGLIDAHAAAGRHSGGESERRPAHRRD